MAQNRDRNWQEREQQRGGWRGEDFGHGERDQQHGSEDHQQGREGSGGWQSGQGQGGEWSRMGRYGEEGWQGGQSGSMGRWGQGGNYGMDRDFGRSGSRPYVGESSWGGSRGTWGGGSGGYGSSGGYGGGFGRGGYGGSYGGSQGQQQGGRGFFDRASDEVSSWFGDEDARRRREQDEHRGRGPKGYTRSDERIREDVNDRLTDDGWLDASDIEVQVSSGEVTLTGQVNSREEKRRAEDIVEQVSGVKNVQNSLRVKDRSAMSGQTATTQMGSTGSGTTGSTKTTR